MGFEDKMTRVRLKNMLLEKKNLPFKDNGMSHFDSIKQHECCFFLYTCEISLSNIAFKYDKELQSFRQPAYIKTFNR